MRRRAIQLVGGVLGCLSAMGLGRWAYQPAMPPAFVTHVGEIRTVDLSDGTRVTLDTDTELRVAYSRAVRRVKLVHGRAWFEVARNKQRPFVVATRTAEVVAVGTRFDVAALEDGVRVTLERGVVDVTPTPAREATRLRLLPGDQVRLDRRGALKERSRVDAEQEGAWRSAVIDLDGMPLGEALNEINRYSVTKIRVAEASLLTVPVSGVFHAGDQAAVVLTLQSLFSLDRKESGPNEVVLSRATTAGAGPAQGG